MTSDQPAVGPDDVARPEADAEDTEGHNFIDHNASLILSRAREQEIQRNLKARVHVVEDKAARGEAKRPRRG